MSTKPRKSRAQAQADRDQLAEIEKFRARMLEFSKRVIALRSKDREFHGLDREFHYSQAQLTKDYLESKDVHHPRDVGAVRECALRSHLQSGFLPKRYGVSDRSLRVAATSGHLSKELDIALFDPIDSFSLMRRKDVFEVLPVESIFGVIQVKSRLSKKELASALDNIASFKSLNPAHASRADLDDMQVSTRGFGLIFAYETEMAWLDITQQVNEFAKTHPARLWPNAIFILNVGIIGLGDFPNICFHNSDIEAIASPGASGRQDQGDFLLSFQSILMGLLRATHISPPPFDAYMKLPLVAGDQSYQFGFGQFSEIGKCETHGDYARRISADKLATLTSWCKGANPINWMKATDIALGKPGDDEERYALQPQFVRIYNPDDLPLTQILTYTRIPSSVAYQIVNTEGMSILLPDHYSSKGEFINTCPACKKKS